MDSSEGIVEQYLRHIGYTDIRYEPDGKVTPDFLVDGSIAIEVRRLNQNHDVGSGVEGLDESRIPLSSMIKDCLARLGPPVDGESWFFGYHFKRPVQRDVIRRELVPILKEFIAQPEREPFELTLQCGLKISIFRASKTHATFYVPAGYTDREAGGFVLHEIDKNLRHCIAEKSAKIAERRSKYPTWWLVLPDYIGYSLDAQERSQFRDLPPIKHNFDKVILVDPLNPERAFVI